MEEEIFSAQGKIVIGKCLDIDVLVFCSKFKNYCLHDIDYLKHIRFLLHIAYHIVNCVCVCVYSLGPPPQ